MTSLASRTLRTILSAALIAAAAPAGFTAAQERDQYGSVVDDRGPDRGDDDVRQTVARVSDLTGNVSYSRGDDPDNWQPADRNVPVTLGDRLYTDDRSRVELQVHGGSYVRLGARTDLAVLNLTDDTKQFAIKSGVASIQVRRLDQDDVFEIDTPNSAITIQRPGEYRVDIDDQGNSRVTVRQGEADLAAGGGSITLASGDAVEIYGGDEPQYETVAAPARDEWDNWVDQRMDRISRTQSAQYVSDDVVGLDDLDEYGRWDSIPSYGRVWSPVSVSVGWTPYRVGRWMWQDPWGWTWVSTEPWGWAPYHYGRWVTYSSRWYWVPVARRVRAVRYSPALVAFVGGGPGWSASVTVGGGGGYVGWFPLAPRDPFIPWWGRRARTNVNVTNITYVNKTYVTVVNRNTFVSSQVVVNQVVRDQTVVRQVSAAPVLRGPIPIVPTRESIRVATRPAAAVSRPPAAVVQRAVVARVAPPPAPPAFDRKLAVIRENRGAPVAPDVAAQVAVRERNRAQTVTTVRPVAAQPGRVTLAPRSQPAAGGAAAPAPANRPAPRVQPVAPVRGRPMATADQPVATAPVAAPRVPATSRREALPEPESARVTPANRVQPPDTARERVAPRTPPETRNETAPTPRAPRPAPQEERRVVTPPRPAPQEERRVVTPPRPGRPAPTAEVSSDRRRPAVEEERRVATPPPPAPRRDVREPETRRERPSPPPERAEPRPRPTVPDRGEEPRARPDRGRDRPSDVPPTRPAGRSEMQSREAPRRAPTAQTERGREREAPRKAPTRRPTPDRTSS